MSYYTVQKQIKFNGGSEYASVIPDAGAEVAVEFANGNGWVTDPDSPITAPARICSQNNAVRLTPVGGGFHVDEGNAL